MTPASRQNLFLPLTCLDGRQETTWTASTALVPQPKNVASPLTVPQAFREFKVFEKVRCHREFSSSGSAVDALAGGKARKRGKKRVFSHRKRVCRALAMERKGLPGWCCEIGCGYVGKQDPVCWREDTFFGFLELFEIAKPWTGTICGDWFATAAAAAIESYGRDFWSLIELDFKFDFIDYLIS